MIFLFAIMLPYRNENKTTGEEKVEKCHYRNMLTLADNDIAQETPEQYNAGDIEIIEFSHNSNKKILYCALKQRTIKTNII